ncbi:hypothetical protein OCZ56_003357 [Salmonella enterica]|nr:hypothetical protein [Salmonella enterica]
MKVSVKRIDDGRKSIDTGLVSCDGHPVKKRIDYISIVSEIGNEQEKQSLFKKLSAMIKQGDEHYQVEPRYPGKNKARVNRYKHTIVIKKRGCDTPYLLRIDWDAINNNAGEIRFDFRPQHVSNIGLNRLLLWLANKHRLGLLLYTLLERAWVTRIDVALDVYGFGCEEYEYVSLKGCSKAQTRVFPDGGKETCLGSRKSSLYIACYPKVDSQGVPVAEPDDDGLVSINTLKMDEFMRFEARLHFKLKGQCGLKSLLYIANPFEKLEFYSKSLFDVLTRFPDFAMLFERYPLPQAKSEYKKVIGKSAFQQFEHRYLHPHIQPDFLNVQAIWEQWFLCVYGLGLLGRSPYWSRKHRERRNDRGLSMSTL